MTLLTSTPRQDGFYMPAEWAEQKQIWMTWPERPDNWRNHAQHAQAAFAAVARAIAHFEPVQMLVSAAHMDSAKAQLAGADVHLHCVACDDAWTRDTGPTFVRNAQGEVRGVDWTFNAWGGDNGGLYADWRQDDQIARQILELEQLPRYRTPGFVLEGGAIHVDGQGTLLTTEECLLNANRNPHLTREQIEAVLAEHLSISQVIWLPLGLYNDETDGHIDNFCCFVRPGEVLLAWTDDPNDPNYPACQAALQVLEIQRDAQGRAFIVHKMPIPGPLYASAEECAGIVAQAGSQERAPSIRLAGSYINFLIVNGGIIAPSFDDPHDAEAERLLKQLFPEHEVVMLPGREILLGGGNIHCITQQQPR